jgi:hypothetical protein
MTTNEEEKKESRYLIHRDSPPKKKGDGLPSYSLSLCLSILHHRLFFSSPSLITINERYQSPIESSLLHEENIILQLKIGKQNVS